MFAKGGHANLSVKKWPRHLKTGDPQPAVERDVPRLYAMRFCPFAQRIHLVLDTKNIPYDVVYVNLIDKPEWLDMKSDGKVPALEFDGQVLTGSSTIADFLDEAYPEPALYPQDPQAKVIDKKWIEDLSWLSEITFRVFVEHDEFTVKDKTIIFTHLQAYEIELNKRDSLFFGGERPGMLDLMMWPWFERLPVLREKNGTALELSADDLPKMTAWYGAMIADAGVKSSYLPPAIHCRFLDLHLTGEQPYDFDF